MFGLNVPLLFPGVTLDPGVKDPLVAQALGSSTTAVPSIRNVTVILISDFL
jgi:hypothetical protein